MTNFKTLHSSIRSRAERTATDSGVGRSRALVAAAALLAAVAFAGCGSGGSSTITVGNENTADNALIKAGEKSSEKTSSSSTGSAKTPTSGPLSKEPKVTVPTGPAPTKLETRELIAGTGAEAKAGDTVTVNDVGVLYASGKQFENTFAHKEPSTFALSGLIPGFGKGIVGMKVGGRRELIIPASLGYGAKGSPPNIPANAPLVFVVDLLAV